VSTKTIYRWLGEGKIPGYRVNSSFRFDRTELLEWATANRIALAPEFLREPAQLDPIPTFEEALQTGGIHYRVEGRDRDSVLANAVRLMRIDVASEREMLLEALRAREDIASTSIGDGIALPHLRNPLRFHFKKPSVTLAFLERPVDWHAADGAPVRALLAIVGSTVRTVLQLHHRTFFALRDPAFRDAVAKEESRESLLAAAQGASARLRTAPSEAVPGGSP
jgi:PTS system nitrogen regulatory IIA component